MTLQYSRLTKQPIYVHMTRRDAIALDLLFCIFNRLPCFYVPAGPSSGDSKSLYDGRRGSVVVSGSDLTSDRFSLPAVLSQSACGLTLQCCGSPSRKWGGLFRTLPSSGPKSPADET